MIVKTKTPAIIAALAFSLSACTATGGGVQSVDPTAGAPLSARQLASADFLRLAEQVANEMLFSEVVAEWGQQGRSPIVYVDEVDSRVYNLGLRAEEVQEHLFDIFSASQVVQPSLARDATNFEYVIESRISSNRQYNQASNRVQYDYTYRLRVTDLEGVIVGQWSDQLSYRQ